MLFIFCKCATQIYIDVSGWNLVTLAWIFSKRSILVFIFKPTAPSMSTRSTTRSQVFSHLLPLNVLLLLNCWGSKEAQYEMLKWWYVGERIRLLRWQEHLGEECKALGNWAVWQSGVKAVPGLPGPHQDSYRYLHLCRTLGNYSGWGGSEKPSWNAHSWGL